uniref:RNase H domain-containing protein n=2 Tax=Rhabditophanes sp. KR3021 TaxID=114890 RepID=A0AC35TVI5_9BILA
MEVEALLKTLELIWFDFKEKGKKLNYLVLSDSMCVVESVNQQWHLKWSETGLNSKNKAVAHSATWKSIQDCLKKLGNFVDVMHVPGHKTDLHNVADKLARGEKIVAFPKLPGKPGVS